MSQQIPLQDILIRTSLQPGDMGYIIHHHGSLYNLEYQYGIAFEHYVGKGLYEFYENYDDARDRLWIAEHKNKIVGFLLLMHRENAAQLRYFILDPAYRGIGLGKKLISLFMDFLHEAGYDSAYLWTTHELHKAAALYTSHGFRLTEEKESEDFGKKVIEQRYDWKLPGARC